MLEKAAALKRSEYSPLGKELKAQTSAAEKQYQILDKAFESNKRVEKNFKSCAKPNLVYSKDFIFYKYHNTNEFDTHSFYSKQNDLIEFKDILK